MKIEFLINDKGELYSFKTSDEEAKIEEFKIPSIVNGVKVESIADTFRFSLQKLYERGVRSIHKLIISDGIEKINAKAFAGIDIEITTVCWPKTCKVIPQYCFFNSKIKSIVGIEEVEEIKTAAFQGTLMKYFDWPERCKVVPSHCFYECNALEQIVGLEEVTDIRIAAFNETALKTFCWPASVSATETYLFLLNCEHLEEIIFGGGGIKDIDLECLRDLKNVKKIDLSRCGAVNLLNATDPQYAEIKGKLILPYYVTEVS